MGPSQEAGLSPKQLEAAAILAGNLNKVLDAVCKPEDQSSWLQFSKDEFHRKEKFTLIQKGVAQCFQGAPNGIAQEAIRQFSQELVKTPKSGFGRRPASALIISAVMIQAGLEKMDVQADSFLPKPQHLAEGYKGEQCLGFGLPNGTTLNLLTGMDPAKQLSTEQVVEALGFEGQAQIQINGVNIEELRPKAPIAERETAVIAGAVEYTGTRPYYLVRETTDISANKEVQKKVFNLHQAFVMCGSENQHEIIEAVRGIESENDISAVREYIAGKLHGSIGHHEDQTMSDDNKIAIDRFVQEIIVESEILAAFEQMKDDGMFEDHDAAEARTVEAARNVLSGLSPSVIEGGVRAFLEKKVEEIQLQASHSIEERHAKDGLSHFLSPFMIEVFISNPELNEFKVDFSRYHQPSRVNMKDFGFGMETILEPQERDGKHITIAGSGPTNIAAARGLGKGVRYA